LNSSTFEHGADRGERCARTDERGNRQALTAARKPPPSLSSRQVLQTDHGGRIPWSKLGRRGGAERELDTAGNTRRLPAVAFCRHELADKHAICNAGAESPTGVFATRSPVRPNLIALTLCKVVSIRENIVEVYPFTIEE